MIIGDGDLAHALQELTNDEDLLFFASGVSNSSETRNSEYKREKDLLLSQDGNKHIVYFSSLSIFFSSGRYQQHKLDMERTIKFLFPHYCIVRLGNISFGKNKNTIINFLKNKIEKNEPYIVQDVYRHIVDKDEFLYWISSIPSFNCEMNVPGNMMKVEEIVEKIKTGIF